MNNVFIKFKNLLSANNIDTVPASMNENKTDYSIKYKNNVIFKIKKDNSDYVFIKNDYTDEIFNFYEQSFCKSFSAFTGVPIDLKSDFTESFSFLLLLIVKKILGLTTYDEFGCCSKYLECSNAKKYLHPNEINYMGCQYKRNLENGRIFYGINKNI